MRILAISGVVLALAMAAAPAAARRIAIDEGTTVTLGGYCDLNTDECGPDDGGRLAYEVKFGGGGFSNKLYVHGNGLLSFGEAIDFTAFPEGGGRSFQEIINGWEVPEPGSYGRNLVGVGQSTWVDFQGSGFYQSAALTLFKKGGIRAEWFTCVAPGGACRTNRQFLDLTPTKGGFNGLLSGSGGPETPDHGFVIDGVFTGVNRGESFFVPAQFNGFAGGVPEPASWAMLIGGFGLVGGAMRRRRGALAVIRG